jgi:DNA mismatch repair protein MutL
VAVPTGTSIAMKNLFFNVPARRNFLKSNAAEMRHIVEEFTRVAMAFPHILFSLTGNGQQIFYLEQGSLKQRIVQLLGNHYNAKMVSVKEETDYMTIFGFAGKPDVAKKTRGDQYFFVNNRFIKSAYLNHAVMNAYQQMIPSDSFPLYVLFIDLDPKQLDVNVHPTKQEIKFEDEKIIYAFVQAAVKHSLAQFSITPALDFDLDPAIQQLPSVSQPFTSDKKEATAASPLYKGFAQPHQAHFIEKPSQSELKSWKDFYAPLENHEAVFDAEKTEPQQSILQKKTNLFEMDDNAEPTQLLNSYIMAQTTNGFVLIHQQAAHERILYEQMKKTGDGKPMTSQRCLFPVMLEMTPSDAVLLQDLLQDFLLLGFIIEPFGNNNFIVQGVPADLEEGNEKHIIDFTLEQYKHFSSDIKISSREKLIRSLARQRAVKTGRKLSVNEMRELLTNLFNCEMYNTAPDGNPVYLEFKQDQMEKMFGR